MSRWSLLLLLAPMTYAVFAAAVDDLKPAMGDVSEADAVKLLEAVRSRQGHHNHHPTTADASGDQQPTEALQDTRSVWDAKEQKIASRKRALGGFHRHHPHHPLFLRHTIFLADESEFECSGIA